MMSSLQCGCHTAQIGSKQLKLLHSQFTKLMLESKIDLMSFAEGERTNLPLNFKATIVPQESCGLF